jgi:hypothetical protein
LILIDELAHTNAPGSRHPKRYQDIVELLDAGIDVFTTVNVQHLESRADAVREITGATVHETVPDSLLDVADEVELVDLTPEQLRRGREALLPGIIARADGYERLADGFRFRFGAADGLVPAIAAMIDSERRCCRFLRFSLITEPAEGPVWLEVRGPAGTDEFLRFCELIGAEPQIALNLGTGTPAEAAEWVRYVNEHWGNKSGGLLWELGNELWGDFQVGYPTLETVAARTKAFSEAIRNVDPKARLIATGGDPDHFEKWNAAQLSNPAGTFNYLSTHFVVTTNALVTRNPSPEQIAQSTVALPIELERRLRAMHQQFQNTPAGREVRTAFTEWLFWSSEDQFSPRYDNMGGAIGTAGLLNMLLRNSDIVPISDMTGIIEFGGIWKKRGREGARLGGG